MATRTKKQKSIGTDTTGPEDEQKAEEKRLQAEERARLKAERQERQRRATAQLRELLNAGMQKHGIPDYAELGRFLEVSHRSVYNFMTAENAQPTLGLIIAIWQKFDIDFRLLLELASPEHREQLAKLKLPTAPQALETPIEKQEQYIAELERLMHQIPGPLQKRVRAQVEQLRDTHQQVTSMIKNAIDPQDEEEREIIFNYWNNIPASERQFFKTLLARYQSMEPVKTKVPTA